MRFGVLTGYFDPIHEGHLAMIADARKYCDHLTIGVNSDENKVKKSGYCNIPMSTRLAVVRALRGVDQALPYNEPDGSCIEFLKLVQMIHPNEHIIYMNGGDRTSTNIPEMVVEGIDFMFGIGGDFKMNSSSDISQDWNGRRFL